MKYPRASISVAATLLALASLPAHPSRLSDAVGRLNPAEAKTAGVSVTASSTIPAGSFIEVALSPSSICSADEALFIVPGMEIPVTFKDSKLKLFVETRMLPHARVVLRCRKQSPSGPSRPHGIGFNELMDPKLSGTQPHDCYRLDPVKKLMIADKPKEALDALTPCLEWHQARVTIAEHARGQFEPDPLGDQSVLQAGYFQHFATQLQLLASDSNGYESGKASKDRNFPVEYRYQSWFQSGLIQSYWGSLHNLQRCLYAEKKGQLAAAMQCYDQGKVFKRHSRMSVLALAQGETVKAANYARHALAIDQYDASAMSTLAAVRERNGDQEGALCLYKSALASLKYYQEAIGALPVAYWEAGAIQKGIERMKGARDNCADERKLMQFMESAPEWVMGFAGGGQ